MALRSGTERALGLLRTLPRITFGNIKGEYRPKQKRGRGQHGGKEHGGPHKGQRYRMSHMRLGFEGGQIPWYTKIPNEGYYTGHHLRRQYKPLTLHQLQLLIDTNRINPNEPVDLTTISNTKIFYFDPVEMQWGFQLTDEGMDEFQAKINLEIQWATERVIAAIERNGGTVTTAYYDLDCLFAAKDPIKYFKKGVPIPKRLLPPEDAIEYYSSAKNRGYLADPDEVAEERLVLAQKYGYELPNLEKDPMQELLLRRKDPRQVFYGLEPGWVVNLRDKCILKPSADYLKNYFKA